MQIAPGQVAVLGGQREDDERPSNNFVENRVRLTGLLALNGAHANVAGKEGGKLDLSPMAGRQFSFWQAADELGNARTAFLFTDERRQNACVEVAHQYRSSSRISRRSVALSAPQGGMRARNAASSSSISASGRFAREMEWRRAAARPWRVITTSSPASTLSNSSLKCAFA